MSCYCRESRFQNKAKTQRQQAFVAKRATTTDQSREQIEADLVAQILVRRLGQAAELAAAMAFLASPAAGFITGVSLPVDSGLIPSI